jgi:hypothetical protein
MLKRIYVYVIAALAALALAVASYFMSTSRTSIGETIKASLFRNMKSPSAESAGVDSNSKLPSNTVEEYNPVSCSYVMSLLQTSKKEQFGSYRLKSTIFNDTFSELCNASIEDLDSGKSRIYRINEMLPDDSQLVDIKQDHVTQQKSGMRKKIYIHPRRTVFENGVNEYKKISDDEYVLKPNQVFKGNPDGVLDFSIKASNQNGHMEGIQISDIPNNALAHSLGLKENDVLLEINQESVNSIYKCIKACINANNSDELQLKIRRADKIIFRKYHLCWQGEGAWTTRDVLNSKTVASFFHNGFAFYLF